jgi:nucleoid-associated protein YgaU
VYAKAYDPLGQASDASKTIKIKIARSAGRTRVMLNTGASYVVRTGDSLWNIARTFLGQGRKYPKIVSTNSKSLPTLLTRPNRIIIGWVLKIPAN